MTHGWFWAVLGNRLWENSWQLEPRIWGSYPKNIGYKRIFIYKYICVYIYIYMCSLHIIHVFLHKYIYIHTHTCAYTQHDATTCNVPSECFSSAKKTTGAQTGMGSRITQSRHRKTMAGTKKKITTPTFKFKNLNPNYDVCILLQNILWDSFQ